MTGSTLTTTSTSFACRKSRRRKRQDGRKYCPQHDWLPQFGGMLGASADRGNIAKLQELLRDKP